MEKLHKFGEERICDICKGGHPTYACSQKIDKGPVYRKELIKGEPDVVEALKITQEKGVLGVDKDTLKEESLKKLHGRE